MPKANPAPTACSPPILRPKNPPTTAASSSRTGVTGAKDALPDDLPALIRRARNVTQLPIAVGFGISLPGHVSVLGGLADAAVVGSALVSEIENAKSVEAASDALAARIRSLKQAATHGLSRREVAP